MSYATSGQTIKYGMAHKPYTVQALCKDNYRGDWVCLTCNYPVGSPSAPHDKHNLVWWCSGHGPEDGHAQAVKDERRKRAEESAIKSISKLLNF